MKKWSEHVHRYAKRHKITYMEAQKNEKCKESYKRKTSPRKGRKSRRMLFGPVVPPLSKVEMEEEVKNCENIRRAKYAEMMAYWLRGDDIEEIEDELDRQRRECDRLERLLVTTYH